jgi:SAM-dependent methyltransferase
LCELESTQALTLKFNTDLLGEYVSRAPLALAFERVLECRIYSQLVFERPVLDIGCGDGIHAKVLFAEKIDTGIDPDQRELERARALDAYAELIACRGDSIPKPDGAYRTIFANSVLEHIPDLVPVLKETYRVLAPGGGFYLTVPSADFERFTVINLALEALGLKAQSARFRKFFNAFWSHHHAYSVDGWAALCRDAGFEVVEAYTFAPMRTCLLNTVLTPFALPAKLLKRATNRWTLFPRLRRILLLPLARLAGPILRGGERAADGGLVFVSLRKP